MKQEKTKKIVLNLGELVDFLGKDEYICKSIPANLIIRKNEKNINNWTILFRGTNKLYIRQSKNYEEIIDKVYDFFYNKHIVIPNSENKGGIYSLTLPKPKMLNISIQFPCYSKHTFAEDMIKETIKYKKMLKYYNKK